MNALLSLLASLCLCALVAALATRFLPRRPALAHALWLAVVVRSLLPSLPVVPTAGWSEPLSALPFLAPPTELAGGGASSPAAGPSPTWLLLVVWALGALVSLVRSLGRSWTLRRCLSLAEPAGAELRAEVRRQAGRLGLRAPAVLRLPSIRTPFLFGLRRPVLVWPEREDASLSRARSAIVLHELAHLARRDPWTAWVETLALAVWWWNPLVWLAVLQTRRYKELACDAWVLEELPGERHGYARALLGAIAPPRSDALPAESLGWVGSAFRVRERLRALYHTPRRVRLSTRSLGVCALLVLASWPGLAGPRAGAQPPSPVPFARGGPPSSTPRAPAPPAALSEGDQASLDRLGVASFEELESLARSDLARNPADGRSYSRLGYALLGQGRYEEAARAFQEQYGLGHVTTYASYNAACAYALLGDTESALAWLERSVESGFEDPLALAADQDLSSLHADARFQALLEVLERQANP